MSILTQFFTNILIALVVWLPGHSLAVSIIVLTLAIRFALLIPNKRALESQRKLQELQPQIDEIRKTIKDQTEQSKALMELYQKNQINPLGSCLPLLIQLPILIVLFAVLRTGFSEHAYSLLYHFIPRPAFINTNFFGIDLTKVDHTFILPILAAGLQMLQTGFMMMAAKKRKQSLPAGGTLFFFSIMTFFIARQMNAGVVLYWVVQSAFGVVQQVMVEKERLKIVGVKDLTDMPELQAELKAAHESPSETTTNKKGVAITVRRPGQK